MRYSWASSWRPRRKLSGWCVCGGGGGWGVCAHEAHTRPQTPPPVSLSFHSPKRVSVTMTINDIFSSGAQRNRYASNCVVVIRVENRRERKASPPPPPPHPLSHLRHTLRRLCACFVGAMLGGRRSARARATCARVARSASNAALSTPRAASAAPARDSRASASGGVWVRHCRTAFMKQVLPRLLRPAPWGCGGGGGGEGWRRFLFVVVVFSVTLRPVSSRACAPAHPRSTRRRCPRPAMHQSEGSVLSCPHTTTHTHHAARAAPPRHQVA